MNTAIPTHAQVVIIGGGIAGCSAAYHLTKLGCTDVVLLEQGKLTCGTTWHAAGLVGQLRPNRNQTRMSRYGIELYSTLEAETGLATGWRQCGSLNIARTPERMTLLKRQMAAAKSFGVEFEFVSPRRAGEIYPVMRTDDLVGAVWIPGDGKANPTDLTQSLAKGARNRGARLFEGVKFTGTRIDGGRIRAVQTEQGEIACESVLNCGGQWARQLGLLSGVNVPLHSAEHFYLVSRAIEGVHPMLPVMRDADGFIYFKEEVGGLLMGGFEPVAKPWGMQGIPDHFEFQLLPDNIEQFQPLIDNAMHRVPALAKTEIKFFLNGPESFTLDGNFILGEAPEVKGYYVSAGFNSAGIANAGGAGRLIAEWIIGGAPSTDLWDVDIRRFAPFQANRAHLRDRITETLGLHYAMRWPRQELESVRPLRRSPLYERLAARGASFGSKLGWERANYFAQPGTAGAPAIAYSLGRPGWLPLVLEEQRCTREAVSIFDQTSFSKFLLQGRDSLQVLQRLCANDIDVAAGSMVYTAMLNARGGFESDLTVIRLAPDRFKIITGSGQATRDAHWVNSHIDAHEFAVLTDVTSAWTVISVMGPQAPALLSRLSPDEPATIRFSTIREIDLAYARVLAARMSYVGGPGYELYVPTEMALGVYDALHAAGTDLGLKDAGYYTIDALRVEAGRRAFGTELGPDETPLEAGLGFAVRMDKPGGFIGRDALRKQQSEGVQKQLLMLALDDGQAFPWGGEPVLRDGQPVGELTSTGYSRALGRAIGMLYVRSNEIITDDFLLKARYEVDIAGERFSATPHLKPPKPPNPAPA